MAPRGARAGLCQTPAPPTSPARQAVGEEAVALGAGTRRAARSSEPDPDATATCAAVIKVGRPRAASRASRSARGVGCVSRCRTGEGCWGRARRGDPAGRGGPGFQPLRVTLHKALLLPRPQFPVRGRGRHGGPLLTGR